MNGLPSGFKSSEFWQSLIAQVLPVLMQYGIISATQGHDAQVQLAAIISGLAATLTMWRGAANYAQQRSMLKGIVLNSRPPAAPPLSNSSPALGKAASVLPLVLACIAGLWLSAPAHAQLLPYRQQQNHIHRLQQQVNDLQKQLNDKQQAPAPQPAPQPIIIQQPAPAPVQPPQIIYLTPPRQEIPLGDKPKQDIPLGDKPKQDIPLGAGPLQIIPIGGQPHYIIPIGGAPKQQIDPGGAPRQQLGPQPPGAGEAKPQPAPVYPPKPTVPPDSPAPAPQTIPLGGPPQAVQRFTPAVVRR